MCPTPPWATSSVRLQVVAADHPSVTDDVERFVCEVLVDADRVTADAVADVARSGHACRLAAVTGGRVVALAGIDRCGDVTVVVARDERGNGVGMAILTRLVARGRALGYSRLVLRSCRPSRGVRIVGARTGFVAIDAGEGRVDLILPEPSASDERRRDLAQTGGGWSRTVCGR